MVQTRDPQLVTSIRFCRRKWYATIVCNAALPLFLLSLSFCCCRTAWCDATISQQSVVTIIAKLDDHRIVAGTGFFVTPDGRILSCYHLVRGARQLQVISRQGVYSQISVEKVSPQYDLVLLRVGNIELPTPYLRVRADIPPEASKSRLTILGFLGGLQHGDGMVAQPTRDHPISLKELTGSDAGLFNKGDPGVFALQTQFREVFNGAPVVLPSGDVVGILAASVSGGQTFVWAIPSQYFDTKTMVPFQDELEMATWPTFKLTDFNESSSRKQILAATPLLEALAAYGDSIERADKAYRQISSSAQRARRALEAINLHLSKLPKRYETVPFAQLPKTDDVVSWVNQMQPLTEESTTAQQQFEQALKNKESADQSIMAEFQDARSALKSYVSTWTQTTDNLQAMEQFSATMAHAIEQLKPASVYMNSAPKTSSLFDPAESQSATSMKAAYVKLRDSVEWLSSDTTARNLAMVIMQHRVAARAIAELLDRELQ